MTRKRINLVVCDRCGAEAPEAPIEDMPEVQGQPRERPIREVQWQGTVMGQGEVLATKFQDLCEDCQRSFRNWVRGTGT